MPQVFLSSTARDLAEFRERASGVINRLDRYHCIQMENFGARARPNAQFLSDQVRQCDLFILLLGPTYGSHPTNSRKSFTELEYETARAYHKPCLVFVSSKKFRIKKELLKTLSQSEFKKALRFRERVRKNNHIWHDFASPNELAERVAVAIQNWETDSKREGIENYLAALRSYCAKPPYSTVYDVRPQSAPNEIYVPLRIRSQSEEIEEAEAIEENDSGRSKRDSISIAEAIQDRRGNHLFIIGKPGAGKTTLLLQLAKSSWDQPQAIGFDERFLPLVTPISSLGEFEGTLENILRHAITHELHFELPKGFLDDWPTETGTHWIFLLDALDEVVSLKKRSRALQVLGLLLHHDPKNLVVLTSRPFESEEFEESGFYQKQFAQYELLSFTPRQTEWLAKKWFGNDSNRFLEELEHARAGSIRDTPLLLAIAAQVYSQEKKLPIRQSQLYEKFVRNWLKEAVKNDLDIELGDKLAGPVKLQIQRLAQLALQVTETQGYERFWPQVEFPGLDLQSTSALVAKNLEQEERLPRMLASGIAEHFVEIMARRSGVFSRHGDQYGFVHATLREYLAAVALASKYVPENKNWEDVITKCLENNWREVLFFYLGYLSDEGNDVSALVRHVWKPRLSRLSQQTQKNGASFLSDKERLHLAVTILTDKVNVNQNLKSTLIEEYISSLKDGLYRESIDLLGQLADVPQALKKLREMSGLGSTDAIEKLEELGYKDDAANFWLSLSKKHRDYRHQALAAYGLERLGRSEEAATLLLGMAQEEGGSTEEYVKLAERIAKLGRPNDAAKILLRLAQNYVTSDPFHPVWISDALGRIGCVNEQAQALLMIASNEELADSRITAADKLKALNRYVEYIHACSALMLNALRNAELNPYRLFPYARDLALFGHVVEALPTLRWVASEGDIDSLSRDAIKTLFKIGQVEDAKSATLKFLADEKIPSYRKEDVVEILQRLPKSVDAGSILRELFDSATLDIDSRIGVAVALQNLQNSEETLSYLHSVLSNRNVSAETRIKVAGALLDTRYADDALRVLRIVSDDEKEDGDARIEAASLLSKRGSHDKELSLLIALGHDEKSSPDTRMNSARELVRLGRVNEAREILFKSVRDIRNKTENRIYEKYWRFASIYPDLGYVIHMAVNCGFAEDATAILVDILQAQKFKQDVLQNTRELLASDIFSQDGATSIREILIQSAGHEDPLIIRHELHEQGLEDDAQRIYFDSHFLKWYGEVIACLGKFGTPAAVPILKDIPIEFMSEETERAVMTAIEHIQLRTTLQQRKQLDATSSDETTPSQSDG